MFLTKQNSLKAKTSRGEKRCSFSQNILLSQSYSKNKSKKIEILTNQKTFLEILLDIMKKAQINYLSNDLKKSNYNQTKTFLLNLKNDLSSMLSEQKLSFNYLQKEHSKKKTEVQNLIFPTNECKRSENCEGNQTIITENDEKTDETEINQIKLMNFKIENEISNIDYFISKRNYLVNYIKNFAFFREDTKEIFCENFKDHKEITEFLHNILIKMRQHFVDMVFQKSKTDSEIRELQSQIEMYNDNYDNCTEKNRYINSEDIIQEESMDFTQSISTSNKNTIFINRKKDSNNGIIERNNLKMRHGTFLCTRDLKQKVEKLGLISQSRRASCVDVNDIKKYLNLNMNINLNINVNNQYLQNTFNSSKLSDEEEVITKRKYDQIDKGFDLYLNEYKKSMKNFKKKNSSNFSSCDENCEYALDIKDDDNHKSISFCSSK